MRPNGWLLLIGAAFAYVGAVSASAQLGHFKVMDGHRPVGSIDLKFAKDGSLQAGISVETDDYTYWINEMMRRAAIVAKPRGAVRIAVVRKNCQEKSGYFWDRYFVSGCAFTLELLDTETGETAGRGGYAPVYFNVDEILKSTRDFDIVAIINQDESKGDKPNAVNTARH